MRRVIALIIISIFLILPSVGGQTTTIQPMKVWTDKPTYTLGEDAAVFWDKNGPCINLSGASGIMNWSGGSGGINVSMPLTQSQLESGSLPSSGLLGGFHALQDIGNWTITLDVQAPNCHAQGTTTFSVAGGGILYELFSSSTIWVPAMIIVVLGLALILYRRHSRK